MTTKRLDEVRPGEWIAAGFGDYLQAQSLRLGWMTASVALSGGRVVEGPREMEVDVAIPPPRIATAWDPDRQVWVISIDTSCWPERTPLDVVMDGGYLRDSELVD